MSIEELIQTALGAGGGAVSTGGFALWLARRWVQKMEERLDRMEASISKLADAVSDMKTTVAVSSERQGNLTGRIDQLHHSIDTTHKDVGRITGSIERLWLILKSKDLVPKRFSDEALG